MLSPHVPRGLLQPAPTWCIASEGMHVEGPKAPLLPLVGSGTPLRNTDFSDGGSSGPHIRTRSSPFAQTQEQPSVAASQPRHPSRFLKGVAISTWQNSPDKASQWTAFVKQKHGPKPWRAKLPSWFLPALGGQDPKFDIDRSPDFWNRYEEDIANAQALGANSFRLSLEWSRIMPSGPGVIDREAVARYNEILDHLVDLKMEVCATLHHFTHPQWFAELGAFEHESNLKYFEEWAVTAWGLFGDRITLLATFNEPSCLVFSGYIGGFFPPGLGGRTETAGHVMRNILRSHTLAYRAIKALPGSGSACIGLVQQHIRFEPQGTGWLFGLSKWGAKWLTDFFGWDIVQAYMLRGEFIWREPFSKKVLFRQEEDGAPPNDWYGVNYYTRIVLDWKLGFTGRPGEVLTDVDWPIYPEGLHEAIVHASGLGKPIYITETGLADAKDDRRADLIRAYTGQVNRAIGEGHDVRGLFYWTLVDNYEWHKGFKPKFGLYAWNADDSLQRRVLRPGAKALAEYFTSLPDDLASAHQHIRSTAGKHAAAGKGGTGQQEHDDHGDGGGSGGTGEVQLQPTAYMGTRLLSAEAAALNHSSVPCMNLDPQDNVHIVAGAGAARSGATVHAGGLLQQRSISAVEVPSYTTSPAPAPAKAKGLGGISKQWHRWWPSLAHRQC